MKQDFKKLTFLVSNNTYEVMEKISKEQYLTISAFVRKAVDTYIA